MEIGVRAGNPFEAIALRAGQAPEPLFEAYAGLMQARVLMAGHRLGLLDGLADQEDDADGLAARLGLQPDGTLVLLQALHSAGYVEPSGSRWRPTAKARRTLLPGASMPLRAWMDFTYDMWDAFAGLEEAVRTGAVQEIHGFASDDPYWERYMRGLFDLSQLSGADVARAIGVKGPQRMLDLAGGHGGFAMALLDRHDGLHATIAELEGAARIGARIADEQGYGERIDFRVGNLFDGDLGGPYDLATAFSIVHHFDAQRSVALARRAFEALRPGGRFAIFELEAPPPGKAATQIGALTSVLFYVTSRARNHTADELAGYLREAGFTAIRKKRLVRAPGSVLVLGDRPA